MSSAGNCKQPTALTPRGELERLECCAGKVVALQAAKTKLLFNFPTFTTDAASPAQSQPTLELPTVPAAHKIKSKGNISESSLALSAGRRPVGTTGQTCVSPSPPPLTLAGSAQARGDGAVTQAEPLCNHSHRASPVNA